MKQEGKQIVIFGIGAGKDGQHTLLFNDCTNLKTNIPMLGAETISFDHISSRTNVKKNAWFNLEKISGYSVSE